MSSSAITTQIAQLKVSNIQNQADSTSIYSNGQWSFKNSTALTSVTITDAGNVGIGTASPGALLETSANASGGSVNAIFRNSNNGANTTKTITTSFRGSDTISGAKEGVKLVVGPVDQDWNGAYLSFHTRGSDVLTERMRIDASGNLLVGTASSSENTDGIKLDTQATRVLKIMKTAAGAVNGVLFYQAGVYQGGLNYGNGSTALATSSDERLKKNIKTAESVLHKIQQVKVCSFDWKDYDAKVEYGFVAQELHQVFPEAVNVGKDNEEGSIEMPWSVSSSTLIPHLVKAIQELSAKNDEQSSRIEALEARLAASDARLAALEAK